MTSSIDQLLTDAVESGALPQAVAVVADRDGVVYEGAAGPRVAGQDGPVGMDTVFRLASMTKMVTTVAALREVEKGRLDLDAPVQEYIPEFAQIVVLEGFDGDTPMTKAPARPATVRHLVTHTSGLAYWFFNKNIVRWEAATGTPNALAGGDAYFTAPLIDDPGARFEYGINTDWLGRVVAAVSGKALDDYFTAEILAPLAMTSTSFRARPEEADRTVPIHVHGPDGAWVATPIELDQEPTHWPGGHGLYSTPSDYLKFQRMLLAGGEFGGERILGTELVTEAFRNQIGELDVPAEIHAADPTATADLIIGPGHKWGYGLLLNTTRSEGMRAVGSGGWSGLFNSHFWVDPTTGITAAIYSNFLPFVDGPAARVYADFERAVYASL